MNTNSLLNYLYTIVDLEKNKKIQEDTINGIEQSIMQHKIEYEDNIAANANNTLPNKPRVNKSGKIIMLLATYLMGYWGVNMGFMGYYLSKSLPIGIICAAVFAVLLGSIPVIIWKRIMKKRQAEANSMATYADEIDMQLEIQRKERNTEIEQIVLPALETELANMKELYSIACNTLDNYYSLNIIPLKYRSFIPVCMFYDYILNKRTYSLEKDNSTFDEGAINMYERECYQNLIISKLDTIIERLDTIIENQKVLYNTIQEGFAKTHNLLNSINDNVTMVNKNLEVIQYQNEQRSNYLEYMANAVRYRY